MCTHETTTHACTVYISIHSKTRLALQTTNLLTPLNNLQAWDRFIYVFFDLTTCLTGLSLQAEAPVDPADVSMCERERAAAPLALLRTTAYAMPTCSGTQILKQTFASSASECSLMSSARNTSKRCESQRLSRACCIDVMRCRFDAVCRIVQVSLEAGEDISRFKAAFRFIRVFFCITCFFFKDVPVAQDMRTLPRVFRRRAALL
jgi:hypothetical protein